MGNTTQIQWCDATFNAWRGCTKVSEGCKNCYAETLSGRNSKVLGEWGPKGKRVIAAESYWKEPLKWNREAEQAGERRRVFCASLADVFEGRDTMPDDSWEPVQMARMRLFWLIQQTPHLDWLLLTKRPQNIIPILEELSNSMQDYVELGIPPIQAGVACAFLDLWMSERKVPSNVWLGTSVENQQTADERIPHLLRVPAKVRFLSMEPLLGPVDLRPEWLHGFKVEPDGSAHGGANYPSVNWVIVGGESGPKARPMHPDWARSLRNECQSAGVPFFFKQWGSFSPDAPESEGNRIVLGIQGKVCGQFSKRVGVCTTGPEDHPTADMFPMGKKAAGRLLDGRTWEQFPELMR